MIYIYIYIIETIDVKIREAAYKLRHRAREKCLSSSMGYAQRERSAFSMFTPITLKLFYMNKIYFIKELSITLQHIAYN